LHTPTYLFASLAKEAASELAVGAFFFVMGLCKYRYVLGPCRTKLLGLRNICFFWNNKVLDLLGLGNSALNHLPAPKEKHANETVHQHANILSKLSHLSSPTLVSTLPTNNKQGLVTSAFLATQLTSTPISSQT
jgi:hypothetical protein